MTKSWALAEPISPSGLWSPAIIVCQNNRVLYSYETSLSTIVIQYLAQRYLWFNCRIMTQLYQIYIITSINQLIINPSLEGYIDLIPLKFDVSDLLFTQSTHTETCRPLTRYIGSRLSICYLISTQLNSCKKGFFLSIDPCAIYYRLNYCHRVSQRGIWVPLKWPKKIYF